MKMTIYIELDSIFDTRLPIVNEVHDVDIEVYRNRTDDNFNYIGEDTFNLLYKYRDRYHLSKAKPTPMIKELGEIANKLIKENKQVLVEIVLNLYPYELLPFEIANYQMMLEKLIPFCEVSLIDVKPTYNVLNKHNVVISYKGLEFLESSFRHDVNLLSPDSSLIVPTISTRYSKGVDLVKGFKDAMKQYEPIINLVYYDTIYWCSD